MDVPNSVPDQQSGLDGSQGEIQMQLPDPDLDQEKYWSKASELITSKRDTLRSTNHSNEYVKFVGSLNDVLGFIEDSLKAKTIEVTSSFRTLLTSLADVLVIERLDFELGFKIVKILIKLSEKNVVSLESVSYVNVVCFLLRSCKNMTEKITVPFSRYMKKLCSYLQKDHIKTACLVEKNKFLLCLKTAFSNMQFCTSDAGVEAIGSFVALDSEFIKEFHGRVLRLLMLCKKAHAISLGTIYFRIWENLSEDEQLVFEEDYIQWLMDRACTLGRHEMAQKHLLINVHALLSGLHQSRKGIKFSKVITKLYTPILWKYLNSNNNIHRCNAAEVFMDVYPLEKPKEGAINYSKNLRKQHEEMLQLLDDACPAIRVIAVKGICLNMQYFWVTFQNGTAERVLKKFVSDLVLDGSSCDVRKAVYQGLTILLKCEQSHDVLKHVLPLLKDFIHDENKSVRQAFIFMLLKIKELDCKIKYHHIVNMENIAARLADDSPKNRLLIVRLILSSFFNERLKLEDSFSRVCKFIKVNPIASRYLARYSYAELKFETAVRFMCLVFLKLRNAIKQTISPSENENSDEKEFDNSHQYGALKSGASLLGMIENIHINDQQNSRHTTMDTDLQASNISESGDTKHLLESRIMHGLLDFIGMLWLIHGKTLLKEENKERLEELYTHSERCLPIILRYSRGTHAYFGALNVATMIPFNKIYHVTTIAGACKTMLCELSPEAPANEYHSFIHALCRWNRGGDIIEIATDQIEDAFRSQSLNESASISKTRSGKRVKFARTETNPMLALRILHELFSSPTDQSTIFSKNTDDLRALFKIISKIKILIKTRIESGSKISDILNDTFLVECLTLYGNLIIMFNQNKVEHFDFWETFYEYLNWCDTLLSECDQCIGSTTEQIVDTVIFDLLKVPLMQSINIIALGTCDYQQCVTLMKFVNSLLHSSYNLYFVDLSLHFIKHLLLFCQTRQDQLLNSEIMSVEFPVIMERILDALTEEVLSKQILLRFIKNFAEFKKNLIFVYCLSLKLYPEVNESNPSYKIMYPFCKSLINVMLFPITESETLNVDQDIKNLPFVGSLLAAVFTTQLNLASALFYVLRVIIEDFADTDGLKLLASISLIYTFAFSKNKIPQSDLLKVVKIMYKKIQKLPTDDGCVAVVMNCDYSIHDRTIIDVEETTERAIKEVGLHILVKVAEKLGCSLSQNTNLGNCTSRKSVLEKSCVN